MFTDLNPKVMEKLRNQGKLIHIDLKGNIVKKSTIVQTSAIKNQHIITIKLLGPIPLPICLRGKQCEAEWYAAVRTMEFENLEELKTALIDVDSKKQNLLTTLDEFMTVNSVLIFGNLLKAKYPLVRVHSNCLTGDVFGSQRCECGPQLDAAVERIAFKEQSGMIVYMAGHEGRGIGLWAKAATYLLQDAGENTYQANESLGLPIDSRDFTNAAALIWRFIGNRGFRLLTNNPKKIHDLKNCGLSNIKMEKHLFGVNEKNKAYLSAKSKWGHHIQKDDLE